MHHHVEGLNCCAKCFQHPYGPVEVDFPEFVDEDIWCYEGRIEAGTILYRARKGYARSEEDGAKVPWSGSDEIGANRAGKASRTNREGKVVLYCADQENTAVAEVRPVRGLVVSVAQFQVKQEVRILDLLHEPHVINPFEMEGEVIPYWISFDDFLERLAWSLAKPLERDDVPGDYLPSQLIAEYIEERGFDGIRYPSAMRAKTANLVFFNPAICEFISSEVVKVTEVDIHFTREVWRLAEDFPEV